MAKLTLIGMHNYDPTLFDDLTFPEGIDKDVAVNNILLTGGEFEVLYPDINFMKSAMTFWSLKWQKTMEKWVEAYNLEYNPLDNYDRTETWTDTKTGTNSKTVGKTSTDTGTIGKGSDSSTTTSDTNTTSGTGTGSTENTVSAYDSDSYQPKDKQDNTTSNSTTSTGSGSVTGHTEDLEERNLHGSENTTENGSDNENVVHTGRVHGNIGVTTSMQLLKDQYDVAKWSLYDNLAILFIAEFTIPIYD